MGKYKLKVIKTSGSYRISTLYKNMLKEMGWVHPLDKRDNMEGITVEAITKPEEGKIILTLVGSKPTMNREDRLKIIVLEGKRHKKAKREEIMGFKEKFFRWSDGFKRLGIISEKEEEKHNKFVNEMLNERLQALKIKN
nr:hypothetical protein [Candidatus Woesearchaeota archaeon]